MSQCDSTYRYPLTTHLRKFPSIFLLMLAVTYTTDSNAGDHGEHHHGHDSSSIELGLSNSLVYNILGGHFAYGLHTHGLYTFAETPFSLGLGYEFVAGEHLHHTIGPMFCYRPIDPLGLCLVPGATFEEAEVSFSAHVEMTYEFEIHGLHIGPTVGFAYNEEDMHVSLGLHTGWSFNVPKSD